MCSSALSWADSRCLASSHNHTTCVNCWRPTEVKNSVVSEWMRGDRVFSSLLPRCFVIVTFNDTPLFSVNSSLVRTSRGRTMFAYKSRVLPPLCLSASVSRPCTIKLNSCIPDARHLYCVHAWCWLHFVQLNSTGRLEYSSVSPSEGIGWTSLRLYTEGCCCVNLISVKPTATSI